MNKRLFTAMIVTLALACLLHAGHASHAQTLAMYLYSGG